MPIDPTRLAVLSDPNSGARLQRGIEKESLRVEPDGSLSPAAHPPGLGSPLTHPYVTTDFSEAQLELITGVHPTPEACLNELRDIHRFVYANIGDELLWPSSMPCLVGEDDDIPVGQYGSSNIGQAKTVYRLGLGLRYGRLMQTISGIHYNFSLPDELWTALGVDNQDTITERYFGLIRNFRRWSWLLIYLFGASPAVCRSFTRNLEHNLQPFDEGSQHLPHATCLRMGPLGYQSSAQSSLQISYNSLDEYASSMEAALTTPYPDYARHGVQRDGEYHQLNTAILQIENEFYGTIRPKQPVNQGERPVNALRARGVEYVEVRCLDLNPFLPAGIDTSQIRFIDTFLLLCLLAESPPDNPQEMERMAGNQLAVVERGREPGLELDQGNGSSSLTPLTSWAGNLLNDCADIALQLDEANGTSDYSQALEEQRSKVADPDQTPSAKVLAAMRDQSVPFFRFTMQQALSHAQHFLDQPLTAEEQTHFENLVDESFRSQQAIEAADTRTFGEFLEEYISL